MIDAVDSRGRSALYMAASYEQAEVVQCLLGGYVDLGYVLYGELFVVCMKARLPPTHHLTTTTRPQNTQKTTTGRGANPLLAGASAGEGGKRRPLDRAAATGNKPIIGMLLVRVGFGLVYACVWRWMAVARRICTP